MVIRNRSLRLVAAPLVALVVVVAAFCLLYRLPVWLIGLSQPWDFRSTSDHLVADAVGLGLIMLGLVILPALTRIIFLAWSPAPHVGGPTTAHPVDCGLPNTSFERTREG
jgi:hypothetical protein